MNDDDPRSPSRRHFMQGSIAGAMLSAGSTGIGNLAAAQAQPTKSTVSHYHVPANSETVHWGYFSKKLKPVIEVNSGDFVTIETVTHHAYDDYERMIQGDPGVESIFYWDKKRKGVNRRGAGPEDASLFGRGAGEGLGVHVCTGPVAVRGAAPGDILELRILDVKPRPSANPKFPGRSFGSNAAAWWGFHYNDLLEEPKQREVITIYEVDATGERDWAQAVYNFRWIPQTDPFGVVHKTIDYPGVPVNHAKTNRKFGVLKNVRVPVRPHFGVLGLAPAEAEMVDSTQRHAAPSARLSATRDSNRLSRTRLQLPELPRATRHERTIRDLQEVLGRPRTARRIPKDAPLLDDDAGPHRRRGDLTAVSRSRLRDHTSRRWQLGCPRSGEEEHLHGRRTLKNSVAWDAIHPARRHRSLRCVLTYQSVRSPRSSRPVSPRRMSRVPCDAVYVTALVAPLRAPAREPSQV